MLTDLRLKQQTERVEKTEEGDKENRSISFVIIKLPIPVLKLNNEPKAHMSVLTKICIFI